jgi:hypothetical protein
MRKIVRTASKLSFPKWEARFDFFSGYLCCSNPHHNAKQEAESAFLQVSSLPLAWRIK